MSETLPPCGLYRTTQAVHDHIPAGRLVYFHNHGDPGPGVYLPEAWHMNRAKFSKQGHVLPDPGLAATALTPLLPEGFYVVEEEFICCEKECRTYLQDELVQLGYNGHGRAILFIPHWVDGTLAVPQQGTTLNDERLAKLRRLKVHHSHGGSDDVTRH